MPQRVSLPCELNKKKDISKCKIKMCLLLCITECFNPFSSYKCSYRYLNSQSAIYIPRICAFASYFLYIFLWREIKRALRMSATDELKRGNLEKGFTYLHIKVHKGFLFQFLLKDAISHFIFKALYFIYS